MIELRNLSRGFKTKSVFKNINLSLAQNDFVYLAGKNGAGKTTLLRVLATLLRPTTGDILIDGKSIFVQSADWRRKISYTPADDNIFLPSLTGRQNILMFARFFDQNEIETQRHLEAVQEIFQINDILDTKYCQASSGMKQKIKIAFAFSRPALLYLFDEPFRSLDKQAREQLQKLLAVQRTHKIMVYTDHSEMVLKEPTTHTYTLSAEGLM